MNHSSERRQLPGRERPAPGPGAGGRYGPAAQRRHGCPGGAAALPGGVLGHPPVRTAAALPSGDTGALGQRMVLLAQLGREIAGNSESLEIVLDFQETILESWIETPTKPPRFRLPPPARSDAPERQQLIRAGSPSCAVLARGCCRGRPKRVLAYLNSAIPRNDAPLGKPASHSWTDYTRRAAQRHRLTSTWGISLCPIAIFTPLGEAHSQQAQISGEAAVPECIVCKAPPGEAGRFSVPAHLSRVPARQSRLRRSRPDCSSYHRPSCRPTSRRTSSSEHRIDTAGVPNSSQTISYVLLGIQAFAFPFTTDAS